MATTYGSSMITRGEERFFFKLAFAMALVLVAGFSVQLAMGRSSFAAPPRVHLHALAFFGWVVLFLVQAALAARGDFSRHRILGRIAAWWLVPMLVLGFVVTIALVREGRAPFFFYPQQFLIGDPLSLLTFAALTGWALARRRTPDWHMRLQICALAAILGPGFGRLLPMPLMIPWGFEIAALAALIFPVIGMLRDKRLHGAVHPAWWRGAAAIVAFMIVMDLVAYSPLGDWLYASAVAGSPAMAVPGLALPPPPPL